MAEHGADQFFLIERERDDLRARIEERVDAMFAAGLVEETCSLRVALEDNRVAQQALDIDRLLGTSKANRTCRTPSRWLNPGHGNSHDDR